MQTNSDSSDKGISLPTPHFPFQFVSAKTDFSHWSEIEPYFEQLNTRSIDSAIALERWISDYSELRSSVFHVQQDLRVIASQNTRDENARAKLKSFIDQVVSQTKVWCDKLNQRFIESEYLSELPKERYEHLVRIIQAQKEIFTEKNVPLLTQEEELRLEYDQICGDMSVNYRGENVTLQRLALHQEDTDRAVREETYRLASDRWLQDKERCNALFEKLVELRERLAANAGMKNYVEYAFLQKRRFDYTQEDCFAFHDAVEKHVVPLASELYEDRRRQLGVSSVRPWDARCDPLGREALRPSGGSTQKLVEGVREQFARIDPEFATLFQEMEQRGELDLESREGKANGGYMSLSDLTRRPFVFMNAVGSHDDLRILLHEFGHCMQCFLGQKEPLEWYTKPQMETSETASMAMELFAFDKYDVFYDLAEAKRAQLDQLSKIVHFLPWCAVVDSFQHWIYANPNHTHDERDSHWVTTLNRFRPGIDWSGVEHTLESWWHRQLHIFKWPLYYIEYGIAQLGALQFFQQYNQDPEQAIQNYRKMLSLAGTAGNKDLFQAGGLQFDFSEQTIAPLIEDLGERIKVLRSEIEE